MNKLDITFKEKYNQYIKGHKASETTFSNLFLWQEKYGFHYIILENVLWIVNYYDDRIYFSEPLGYFSIDQLKTSISLLKKEFDLMSLKLKKCEEQFIELLSCTDIEYTSEEVRDDFDYLYDFSALKELKGNKYHKKKNHVNYFIKHYDYHHELITSSNIKDIEPVIEMWFQDKTGDVLNERVALEKMIHHFEALDLIGMILYVEEKAVGFAIAETHDTDTLLIHFEKGNTHYQGVYPTITYLLLNLVEEHMLVNREQDLGIEGLRKSKLSYHPVDFVKKYNVIL